LEKRILKWAWEVLRTLHILPKLGLIGVKQGEKRKGRVREGRGGRGEEGEEIGRRGWGEREIWSRRRKNGRWYREELRGKGKRAGEEGRGRGQGKRAGKEGRGKGQGKRDGDMGTGSKGGGEGERERATGKGGRRKGDEEKGNGRGVSVLDTKSQNIPEVGFVRRWAVGVLGISREGVGI
jgi:hypothetical protein